MFNGKSAVKTVPIPLASLSPEAVAPLKTQAGLQ